MQASEFLSYVIDSLVDNKDEIAIEEKHDDLGTLLTLRVSKSDMGTIIGKEGRTISAIRTVLRVYGSKHDERVNLKILED